MATRLTPKKSVGRKPAVNGPAASAGTENEERDSRSTLSPGKTASAIWGRIVKPEQANFTPELARTILKLDFDPEDYRRVDELSAKAQKGPLTLEEQAELDELIRVDLELAVLRSKARLSLKRANQSL